MIAIEPGAAGLFMQRLGPAIDALFGRPRAVVIMSPHTSTRTPYVLGAAQHNTIHDFGGFPAALYEVQYNAPGAPELAREVNALLVQGGLPSQLTPQGGLDHGIWTTLMHAYPQADVPVVPVSLMPHTKPDEMLALGRTLRSLAHQGVLVIGSGSLTHNLQRFFGNPSPVDAPEEADCAAFRAWVDERTRLHDWLALLDYRAQAPYAREMHPTDEHWLPFYFAAGAAVGTGQHYPEHSVRLHGSVTHGHLAMDAYAFGPQAGALLAALG
jgi:4,5-DOPA dioxygenase extradiol